MSAFQARRPQSPTHRMKFMVAGVAVASAGAMAVSPVVPVTAVPNMTEVRSVAVELAAFDNPLAVLNEHAVKTINRLLVTGADGATSVGAVLSSLANPGFQAEFAGFVRTNLENPLLVISQLLQAPGLYGGRIIEALRGVGSGGGINVGQVSELLGTVIGFVARGEFVEAFSTLNNWLLLDVLNPGRTALLDAFSIPGDFAESIGAAPLARVFDATLNRAMLGDFARALLGPVVTTSFQTAEIMDDIVAAVRAGDLVSLVSHVINAPIRIVSAFVNGYVPGFAIDPTTPNPTGQVFPGLFGPRGTFDFFFRNVPTAIANALKPPVPAPAVAPLTTQVTPPAITEVEFGGAGILLSTETAKGAELVNVDTGIGTPADLVEDAVVEIPVAPAEGTVVAVTEEIDSDAKDAEAEKAAAEKAEKDAEKAAAEKAAAEKAEKDAEKAEKDAEKAAAEKAEKGAEKAEKADSTD
ncbi:MAG: hypothetical protein ACSLFA_05880 [Mycobacterium sp.]